MKSKIAILILLGVAAIFMSNTSCTSNNRPATKRYLYVAVPGIRDTSAMVGMAFWFLISTMIIAL